MAQGIGVGTVPVLAHAPTLPSEKRDPQHRCRGSPQEGGGFGLGKFRSVCSRMLAAMQCGAGGTRST